MKKMNVRFEQDKTLGDIDIVIRASEQDEQVKALVESLSRQKSAKLTVFDRDGCTCMIEEEKIVMVSADGKNVRVTATDGIYKAKQSLQNTGRSSVGLKGTLHSAPQSAQTAS